MRILAAALLLAAAACKPKAPAPASAPAGAAVPAAESPMEQNKAEKYVSGLQLDVKRAQEAKDKADAAIKKAQEAAAVPE